MTILAIDIGGTKIRAGLVGGQSTADVRDIPTAPLPGDDSIMPAIVSLARSYSGFSAIAVASAGVISDGRVTAATDLIPNWAGTDIAQTLRSEFDVPVTVIGDVHAHGLGEAAYGAAAGCESSLIVGVGTGSGGAYISPMVPMVGSRGVAGHIGHIGHGAAAGLPCSCGRTGHIEPLASGTGLAHAYERATGERIGGRELDERAEDGDADAVRALQTGGHALGEVLGSLANTLDPDIIVVSGSVSRSVAFWWPALLDGFAASAMDAVRGTPLVAGALGDDAPLIGAAAYCLKENDA